MDKPWRQVADAALAKRSVEKSMMERCSVKIDYVDIDEAFKRVKGPNVYNLEQVMTV
jgi:hypothetical protein